MFIARKSQTALGCKLAPNATLGGDGGQDEKDPNLWKFLIL